MEKKKVRKNIDLSAGAVKKLKLKAAKKDTNVKNLIEQIIENEVTEKKQ